MQTVAQRDELRGVEYASLIDRETDSGTIEGVLWSLAIMMPIYAGIAWFLISG